MASAASLRDTRRVLNRYFEDMPIAPGYSADTYFYALMLHPLNDARERHTAARCRRAASCCGSTRCIPAEDARGQGVRLLADRESRPGACSAARPRNTCFTESSAGRRPTRTCPPTRSSTGSSTRRHLLLAPQLLGRRRHKWAGPLSGGAAAAGASALRRAARCPASGPGAAGRRMNLRKRRRGAPPPRRCTRHHGSPCRLRRNAGP